MHYKLHQILLLIFFMGLVKSSLLPAQTVRNFTLPVGAPYVFTEHMTPSPGYSFIGSYKFTSAANFASTLLVIDEDGAPAYVKEKRLGDGIFADFRIYKNGLMSYFNYDQITDKGKYMIMDSTFSIIDSVECAQGLKTDGHDMLILGNGNFLIICLEEKIMDLRSVLTINNRPGYANAVVVAPVIQELDATRNVVFNWRALEHFSFSDIDSYFFQDPGYMDFGHANALSLDLDGNFILSLRFFNELTKINLADSTIMWRLGGKNNDFTFVNDTSRFSTQHHCTVLPNGNIILYDNSELGDPARPRGVEYRLNITDMTATMMWEYANTTTAGYSYALGGMDRVSENGNSVIAWGAGYTPGFTNDIVEVTYDGQLVSELDWPQDYFSYRVFKRTPTWDMERLRPKIVCDTTGGIVTLTATAGYTNYKWNTGATTPSITISQTGEYYVIVDNNDGIGYFGSRLKKITDLAAPCFVPDTIVDTIIDTIIDTTTLVPLRPILPFALYPNPAQNNITISNFKHTNGEQQLVVYSMLGTAVFTKQLNSELETFSVANLPNGSYIGIITSTDGIPIQRFKFLVLH